MTIKVDNIKIEYVTSKLEIFDLNPEIFYRRNTDESKT